VSTKVGSDSKDGNVIVGVFGREVAARKAREAAERLLTMSERMLDPNIAPNDFRALRRTIENAWATVMGGWSADRRARMTLLNFIDGQVRSAQFLLLARAYARRSKNQDLSSEDRRALDRFERGKKTEEDDRAVGFATQHPDASLTLPPSNASDCVEPIVLQFGQEFPEHLESLKAASACLKDAIEIWKKRGAPPVAAGAAPRKWEVLAKLVEKIGLPLSAGALEQDWLLWSKG